MSVCVSMFVLRCVVFESVITCRMYVHVGTSVSAPLMCACVQIVNSMVGESF